MTNPLDPVIDWYTTARDGLRVTGRVLRKSIPGAITNKYVFHAKTPADSQAALDLALEELNRLAVLALTAVFERTLRDYLCGLPVIAPPSGDKQHDAVRNEILKDVEFWNVSSRVLDVFPAVDTTLRGAVRQIIDYRNWVAHGRTRATPPPINITPADSYLRLTDFLTQAGVISP